MLDHRLLVNPPGGGVVTVSGSVQDLRGLIAVRPDADSVAAGTTYWAVDRIDELDEVSVSTGAVWVNV